MNDNFLITKTYRMICAKFNLQKRDGDQLVQYFKHGGYDISKSRAMNLLFSDHSMRAEELHAFVQGFFFGDKC